MIEVLLRVLPIPDIQTKPLTKPLLLPALRAVFCVFSDS